MQKVIFKSYSEEVRDCLEHYRRAGFFVKVKKVKNSGTFVVVSLCAKSNKNSIFYIFNVISNT